MKKKVRKNKGAWDQCKCLQCGNIWNASETDDFNFTFCYNCFSSKIGGKYWEDKKRKKI